MTEAGSGEPASVICCAASHHGRAKVAFCEFYFASFGSFTSDDGSASA